MTLNTRDLRGIPVNTKAGQQVGKAVSIDLDTETGRLLTLRVKPQGVISALVGGELLIAWSQILSITPEEILVADGVIPREAEQPASIPATA